jgi:hypothetical protein
MDRWVRFGEMPTLTVAQTGALGRSPLAIATIGGFFNRMGN